jgi:hypothetical protein
MVVIWYVIRLFRYLCIAVSFSRPFMCLMSAAVGSRGASFQCCIWSSTRWAADWKCDGRGLRTTCSPSTVTDLTPAGFGEVRIAVGGPPTDGLLPVYRRFSLFGGAETLPTIRRSSRGPCAAPGNVFCSSPPLGGNGSPTASERTSISLCTLASQFQAVADFASASNVS